MRGGGGGESEREGGERTRQGMEEEKTTRDRGEWVRM